MINLKDKRTLAEARRVAKRLKADRSMGQTVQTRNLVTMLETALRVIDTLELDIQTRDEDDAGIDL